MKDSVILELVKKCDIKNTLPLTYNSISEEALKLASLKFDKFLIVKENTFYAQKLYQALLNYYDDDEIVLFTPEESLRSEAIISSFENKINRIKALENIIDNKNKIVITTPYGMVKHLPDFELLKTIKINIHKNKIYNRDDLIKKLKSNGYQQTIKTDTVLNYSVRGSILDIFSVNYENPIRIEFFDDEIESIRFFDIENQKTIKEVNEVEICFGSDVIFSNEQIDILNEKLKDNINSDVELDLSYINNYIFNSNQYLYYSFLKNNHLKDYLKNYTVYLSNFEGIKNNLDYIFKDNINYIQEIVSEGRFPLTFNIMGNLDDELKNCSVIHGSKFLSDGTIQTLNLPITNLKNILEIIKNDDIFNILILDKKEITEIEKNLQELNFNYNLDRKNIIKGINIIEGVLDSGFEITKHNIKFYSSKEIFNHKKIIGRYNKTYQEATILNSYDELNIGDYVVHNNYGIGQYLGIFTKEINNIKNDYLNIAYKGNDVLSVPLSQFQLVRKYISKDGFVPKLHKLGSKEWQNTKNKVRESIENIADELINLYQTRKNNVGYVFDKDNEIQKEFENDFYYELTKDQDKAINEIKKDMESPIVMDRLLCGDVGFGKTEVALRASMKAVLSNKQVAYLCPTTILSMQQYNTFVRRFEKFGVNVKLLNRYLTTKEVKNIIQDLKKGSIDIIIGTHKLLSDDIEYKDLGFLIIDEEHRFGVIHKEKIKKMKTNIDVLSLSATPIPRTLQMSLVGIRGLSTLNKAPLNRYPVQTYIVEKNIKLIKEIILKEIQRDGQVFYLYNDTEKIYGLATLLKKEIPEINIGIVHGKMNSEAIEDVMQEFYLNKINLLICTTIIETGLDIPNANTIIVENAQNFGLSQLYQIKGRVGRSQQVGYAYLLIPKNKELTENSHKRLQAIKEFSDLGSGYKIAMRDLSIRGAGDLLGSMQSGFIDSVGFDLYMDMLTDVINQKQNLDNLKNFENNHKNIDVDSYIPNNFSNNDYEKLDIYHQLNDINDFKNLELFYIDTTDKFGKLPKEIENIINKKKIEILINIKCLYNFKLIKKSYHCEISEEYSNYVNGRKLFEYCNELSKDFIIGYKNKRLIFDIINQSDNLNKLIKVIEYIKENYENR